MVIEDVLLKKKHTLKRYLSVVETICNKNSVSHGFNLSLLTMLAFEIANE